MPVLLEALVLIACGALICLIAQVAAVHFFLRVFVYLQEGIDMEKKGDRNVRSWLARTDRFTSRGSD